MAYLWHIFGSILVALAGGCREGELLAPRWDQLNPEEGTIDIKEQVPRIRDQEGPHQTKLVILEPKSKAG